MLLCPVELFFLSRHNLPNLAHCCRTDYRKIALSGKKELRYCMPLDMRYKKCTIRRSLEHVFPQQQQQLRRHPTCSARFFFQPRASLGRATDRKAKQHLLRKKKLLTIIFSPIVFPGKENSHSPDFCFYLRSLGLLNSGSLRCWPASDFLPTFPLLNPLGFWRRKVVLEVGL